MNLMEERDLGVSAKEVFDCTCYMPPAEGKIAESATSPVITVVD